MKRLAIVYGTDGEYIKEVLSFFHLQEMRREGARRMPQLAGDSPELDFPMLVGHLPSRGEPFRGDRKTRRGAKDREILAVEWGGVRDEPWKVWSVNDRFEVEEEISDRLPVFEEAVILNLPASAEQSLHRKISSFLQKRHVRVFNPYSASGKAGNKYFTISKLIAKNIPVPESILLRKPDASRIIPLLSAFLAGVRHEGLIAEWGQAPLPGHKASGFYIQPNEGTEGRETYFFSSDEFRESPEFTARIIDGILLDRDVIVKRARGNVFYYKKAEKERGYRPVAFRVFLWQPEDKVEADLGFAEISASERDFVTSPERGGRIITPAEAMADLYYREAHASRRIVLSDEEKRSLPESAVRALAAFNSGLKRKLRIAGVDLLLEVAEGKVRPIVLEINPRPSGLDKLAKFSPSHRR